MDMNFELTPKQAEYIRNAHHRWNVSCGAVRSGKSYCQISYCIPSRLLERRGLRGIRVILGATRANIERNILQPMRDVYGDSVASSINSQNFAKILGERVYCIGADNVRQVAKIRGSEIAYCAIDEATDINEEVFEMLKSRLSLPWSCCDITTNPSYPSHWFKEFLDSVENGVDIYLQTYTLYDNPFLPEDYIKSLEIEYAGSVWYGRYILGEWTQAEGLVYPLYLDALVDVTPDALPDASVDVYEEYALSIDYGVQNAFAALLWGRKEGVWYCFRSYYHSGRDTGRQKTDEDYKQDIIQLVNDLPHKAFVSGLYTILDPSAASFIVAMKEVKINLTGSPQDERRMFRVVGADNDVFNGINNTARCMQRGVIKMSKKACPEMVKEFGGYVWDKEDRPLKENDHAMDAMRYFVQTKNLVRPKSPYISAFVR